MKVPTAPNTTQSQGPAQQGPSPEALLMAMAQINEMRKSTNIEDDRQGQMQKLKAAIPPEERGGIYQEDIDDQAKILSGGEGKRMKPRGGPL